MQPQEKMIRRIIKDQVKVNNLTMYTDMVEALTQFLAYKATGSRTKIEAAIIRYLDQYYGVSEQTLQLGRAIYLLVYDDED